MIVFDKHEYFNGRLPRVVRYSTSDTTVFELVDDGRRDVIVDAVHANKFVIIKPIDKLSLKWYYFEE